MPQTATLEQDISNRQTSIPLRSYENLIILGAGGVGSWVAFNAALTGQVERIFLVDDDIVESSNLNRTPFRMQDIGELKVAALKYMMLERRPGIEIILYKQKTCEAVFDAILEECDYSPRSVTRPVRRARNLSPVDMRFYTVIVDCRDDVFTDFYEFPAKYYKVGYDGLSVTLDGNPKNTPVWGQANTYQVTPSFVCPAQMLANLVVQDIFVNRETEITDSSHYEEPEHDDVLDCMGRLNECFTIETEDLILDLYNLSKVQNETDESEIEDEE